MGLLIPYRLHPTENASHADFAEQLRAMTDAEDTMRDAEDSTVFIPDIKCALMLPTWQALGLYVNEFFIG